MKRLHGLLALFLISGSLLSYAQEERSPGWFELRTRDTVKCTTIDGFKCINKDGTVKLKAKAVRTWGMKGKVYAVVSGKGGTRSAVVIMRDRQVSLAVYAQSEGDVPIDVYYFNTQNNDVVYQIDHLFTSDIRKYFPSRCMKYREALSNMKNRKVISYDKVFGMIEPIAAEYQKCQVN